MRYFCIILTATNTSIQLQLAHQRNYSMLSSIENRNHLRGDVSLNSKASDHCSPGTTSYYQHKHFYEAKKKNIYNSYSNCSQEENKQQNRQRSLSPKVESLVDIRNYLDNLSYLLEQEENSKHFGRKLDLSKVMKLYDEVQSSPKRKCRRRKSRSKVEIKHINHEDQKKDQKQDDEEEVEPGMVQPIRFSVKIQQLFSVDSEEIEVSLY